jgi:hypothetical protein
LWAYYTDRITSTISVSVIVLCASIRFFGVLLLNKWQRYSFTANLLEEMVIVLLDPIQSHRNMRDLFDDDFIYIREINTCMEYVRSHNRNEIILFVSDNNAQALLPELGQYDHVILYIFHKKLLTQTERSIYSANGKIRFVFHESQLREYLRHTMIIYYSRRAEDARQLEDVVSADLCYHAARQQCIALAKELEAKIDTEIATDAQDLPIGASVNDASLGPVSPEILLALVN